MVATRPAPPAVSPAHLVPMLLSSVARGLLPRRPRGLLASRRQEGEDGAKGADEAQSPVPRTTAPQQHKLDSPPGAGQRASWRWWSPACGQRAAGLGYSDARDQ